MRLLQAQFPGMKDRIRYKEKGELRVILNLMVLLYNFQCSRIGHNEIFTTFMNDEDNYYMATTAVILMKKQTWTIFLELPDYNNHGKVNVLQLIHIYKDNKTYILLIILSFFTTFNSLTLLLSHLPLSSSSFAFTLLFTGLLLLTRPLACTDINAPTAAAIVLLNAFLLRLSSSRRR
jgi:hypothetical protein